jgi:hypothetical protein
VICLFNLLVAGLLLALALHVGAALRERRLRAPLAVQWQDHRPDAPSPHVPAGDAVTCVVGLRAEVVEDGVHLEFYLPPNQWGITSPITYLVSTRRRDEHGTLFEMTTAGGGSYLVSLSDDRARQVLTTFFAWKNGPANSAPLGLASAPTQGLQEPSLGAGEGRG